MVKAARPDTYTKEIGDRICDELVSGRTLRSILLGDEGMPDPVTCWRWRKAHADFDAQVTAARAAGMELLVDETRDIADDGSNDWMEAEHGGYRINTEALGRSKLRIDQRFREAEALAPHVYGRRQTIEHQGAIGVHLTRATDDELVEEMIELLSTGRLKLPPGFALVDETDDVDDDPDGVG
jgi:hypothetical protein